jgi:hypothetical protein
MKEKKIWVYISSLLSVKILKVAWFSFLLEKKREFAKHVCAIWCLIYMLKMKLYFIIHDTAIIIIIL